MVEKVKCNCCRQVYELIWEDPEIEDWKDDFDDGEDELLDEDIVKSDDPVYCPFCGVHVDYAE